MVQPNRDPVIQAVEANDWHMYAIQPAQDELDRAQRMAATGPATEVVPEVPYMFSPGTDVELLARAYGLNFHGPSLRVEDINSDKYVGGLLMFDRQRALFSRFMLTKAGIVLCSPRSVEEGGVSTDQLILAPATAAETFAADFAIMTPDETVDLFSNRAQH